MSKRQSKCRKPPLYYLTLAAMFAAFILVFIQAANGA
jgi:hypothetical protein